VVSPASKCQDDDDDCDDEPKFYVSQSLIYEQSEGENLRWRIIVAMPVEISKNDGLFNGDPMFFVVIGVGTVGCVACLLLFHFYFSKRKKTEVRMSDWRFTSAFILGCALLNLTTLTYIGPATDQTCMLRMWSFHVVFVLALAPLLVKVWRIYKLVGSADRAVRLSITNKKAMLFTMPAIFLQIFILTLFSIFDPSKKHTYVAIDGSSSSQHSICKHDTLAFLITQSLFEGGLVFVGCLLAFKTRNLCSTLGEAKQLGFAMYNVGLVAVIVMLMGSFLHVDQKTVYVIMTVGTFWATVFSSCAFVLPRLLQVQRRNTMQRNTRRTSYGDHSSKSFASYIGPMAATATATQARAAYQGGSLYNEPRSQIPISSIHSSSFQGSSEFERTSPKTKNNNNQSEPSNRPLEYNHEQQTQLSSSDIEEDHDDSDSDSNDSFSFGDDKPTHRNTSFTKLSISPSESDVLQELAEKEDQKAASKSFDSTDSRSDIEGSIVFESDFVIDLEKNDSPRK